MPVSFCDLLLYRLWIRDSAAELLHALGLDRADTAGELLQEHGRTGAATRTCLGLCHHNILGPRGGRWRGNVPHDQDRRPRLTAAAAAEYPTRLLTED